MLTYCWVPLQIMRHMLLHAEEVLNVTNFDRIHVYPLSGIYGLVLIVFLQWTYFFWEFCPGLLLTAQTTERGKLLFFSGRYKEKQRVSNIFNENGELFTWKPFQTYTIYHLCTYKRQVVPQNRVSIISFVGSFCIYGSVIYKWKDVCVSKDYQIHGHVSNPARQAWYAIYWEISWTDLVFINRLQINMNSLVKNHTRLGTLG